jgi:hypothetical protein
MVAIVVGPDGAVKANLQVGSNGLRHVRRAVVVKGFHELRHSAAHIPEVHIFDSVREVTNVLDHINAHRSKTPLAETHPVRRAG